MNTTFIYSTLSEISIYLDEPTLEEIKKFIDTFIGDSWQINQRLFIYVSTAVVGECRRCRQYSLTCKSLWDWQLRSWWSTALILRSSSLLTRWSAWFKSGRLAQLFSCTNWRIWNLAFASSRSTGLPANQLAKNLASTNPVTILFPPSSGWSTSSPSTSTISQILSK